MSLTENKDDSESDYDSGEEESKQTTVVPTTRMRDFVHDTHAAAGGAGGPTAAGGTSVRRPHTAGRQGRTGQGERGRRRTRTDYASMRCCAARVDHAPGRRAPRPA